MWAFGSVGACPGLRRAPQEQHRKQAGRLTRRRQTHTKTKNEIRRDEARANQRYWVHI